MSESHQMLVSLKERVMTVIRRWLFGEIKESKICIK